MFKFFEFIKKTFLYYVLGNKNIEKNNMLNSFTGMPIGQGSPFGAEMQGGPMISGSWLNKQTGQKIFVRDSIIDGDNMIIISDVGQINMDDFSRNYIQVSDEVYNEQGSIVETKPVISSDIINTVNDFSNENIKPDYGVMQQSVAPKKVLNNFEVIDKIFTKINTKPNIKFDIKWAKFPTNELQMLVNFLDVTEEDIAAYVVDKFVNQDEISASMKTFVKEQMNPTKDKAK